MSTPINSPCPPTVSNIWQQCSSSDGVLDRRRSRCHSFPNSVRIRRGGRAIYRFLHVIRSMCCCCFRAHAMVRILMRWTRYWAGKVMPVRSLCIIIIIIITIQYTLVRQNSMGLLRLLLVVPPPPTCTDSPSRLVPAHIFIQQSVLHLHR